MSECADRFRELTQQVEVILDEDLPALRRKSERSRIEQYNELKANEETFLREFTQECPEFLTPSERSRVRGNFRLARLLLAASFYSEDGHVPAAMDDDFIQVELDAIVEFDQYRQFDALSESQIEEKIRRMEGEVYELVEEYTSTQLATIEELLDHPDVQRDLMERLLDRYEQRREKIRQGFFIYVEIHGLEHMVGAIEEAVEAVNTASAEREDIQQDLRAELNEVSEVLGGDYVRERTQIGSKIDRLEAQLADSNEVTELREKVDQLEEQVAEASDSQDSAVTEMDTQIEQTAKLDQRIEMQIEELRDAQEKAVAEATTEASEEAKELVENELTALQEQRDEIQHKLDQLKRERKKIVAARESITERRQQLEDRVSQIEQSTESEQGGIEGDNVVTAQMAKILEMDYLGRFDISMHETTSIYTGEGEFDVPDGYWQNRSQRRNNYAYLVDLLDQDVDDPNQFPVNETARYEITLSRYLGLGSQKEMVIEARVVSNLHAHATNGFDAQPADLDVLLSIINEVVAEAETGEYQYLLGLASPTGWSEQVREEIMGDDIAKSRYSQYVSVCLINLQNGSLTYDKSDSIVRENADLFIPPISEEQVQDCIEVLRAEYIDSVAHESVLLRDIVSEHGYDSEVVKRAFNELEDQGAGEQLYLDELGLSFAFESV